QYMEEADRLAERIAVFDRGSVIAEGTPDELKDRVGGERVELVVAETGSMSDAAAALAPFARGQIQDDPVARRLTVPVSGGACVLVEAIGALASRGVEVRDVGLRRPTMDDVFLALTGHESDQTAVGDAAREDVR
ncbi:MAG: DUF4162 domain-containing protein, partial [Dehalococcoidia bacterium]|nr:DUF4162 domain-containing protein [Dehalococcoidia bacterium]